jgi:hypothetical protein
MANYELRMANYELRMANYEWRLPSVVKNGELVKGGNVREIGGSLDINLAAFCEP